jgi:hypothetical protein
MKNISILLFALLLLPGCLKAKKSPFDFNSPGGFIFGFVIGSQGSQTFSISGNITGFTSGSLVLQNNGQNDLTITAPTDKYSFSGLSSGATYLISVKSHPTGMACTLTKSKGTISASITDAHINCTAATANALYTLGDATKSYWLDYVKSDGTSPLDATGTACTGSETGYYNACIHAGEFKKISIPNITSCDGITATDSLSAFNWKCVVASDGSVSVISTGLRGDKGLSDLIDFTSPGSFRNNSVTVLSNGNSLLTSATGKWWDNSIVVNNNGGTLNVTKTIYIINNSASTSSAYDLRNSKVALVLQLGLQKPIPNSPAIDIDQNFTWVEGSFSGTAGNIVINYSANCKFNVVRNFSALTAFGNGFAIVNSLSSASYFSNIRGVNAGTGAAPRVLNLNNTKNIINGLTAYSSAGDLISINNPDNIIMGVIAANGGANGIISAGSTYTNNLYLNTLSANNVSLGVSLTNAGGLIYTTYSNLISVNHATSIENLFTRYTKYINIIAAHSTTNQYDSNSGGSNTSDITFNGIFKVSGNFCSISASANQGIGATCNKLAPSETTTATVNFASLSNSFVGRISADSVTTQTGTLLPNSNVISNSAWVTLSNPFRTWGLYDSNSSFPLNTQRGKCAGTANTCAIWDWSLKATDTVARNVNACPNGTIFDTHQWSDTSAPNQAYCDANYKGSKLNGSTCVTTFLRNAVEILGDGVGNENGICESSEECLYTPNIGAYQGHSSDSTNSSKLIPASQASTTTTTCPDVTTGGTITNVKLWKYDTNGY